MEFRRLLSSIGFVPHTVSENDVASPRSVYAADLDGDGDLDALSASFWDNKVAWYENTDGQGTFGQQRVITTSAEGASCVVAADIDGDSDNDVLVTSTLDNRISWHENTDGKGRLA